MRPTTTSAEVIPVAVIRVDTERMPIRREPCPDRVEQICRQIQKHPGSLAPIVVWPDPRQPGGFLLVQGCHAVAAVRRVGSPSVSAIVLGCSEEDAVTMAAMHLVHPPRSASAWEKAQAIRILWQSLGQPSGRELATRVELNRTQVARYLKAGQRLPGPAVLQALDDAEIDHGVLQDLSLNFLYTLAQADLRLDDRIARLEEELTKRDRPTGEGREAEGASGPFLPGTVWHVIGALIVLASGCLLIL